MPCWRIRSAWKAIASLPERPTAGQALVVSLAWQVLQSPGERLEGVRPPDR